MDNLAIEQQFPQITTSTIQSQSQMLLFDNQKSNTQLPQRQSQSSSKSPTTFNKKNISKSSFDNLIMRLKLQQLLKNFIKYLPSRMYKNLDLVKIDLINDKAINSDQYKNKYKKSVTTNKINSLTSITTRLSQVRPCSIFDDYHYNDEGQQILQSDTFFTKLIKKLLEMLPILNPCNNARILWDLLLLSIVMLFIFCIPIHLIYGKKYHELIPLFIVILTPFILIIELCIALNTGYFEKGIYVESRHLIMLNWLKNILPIDIIANFPLILDVFVNSIQDQGEEFSYFQLFSLLFILNLRKLLARFNKIQEMHVIKNQYHNLISLFKLLAFLLILGHIFACSFLLLGINNDKNQEDSWLQYKQLSDVVWEVQYLNSYYFGIVTMGTVGYGDLAPIANNEKILVIFLILISCGVFGYSLNCINQIFEDFLKENNLKQKNVFAINRYMNKKNISQTLQQQVREYLTYVMKESMEDNDIEQRAMNLLSESLREKLLVEANKIILIDSPLFKENFSSQIINKTVSLIKEYKCAPEQIICCQGQDCSNIYFIEQGTVELYLPNHKLQSDKELGYGQTLQILGKGDSFGAYSFFSGKPQQFNIRSVEFSVLLYIRREDFFNLVQQYSEDYERFCYMKDNISLYNNFDQLNLFCNSCAAPDHIMSNCPFVHYVPQQNKIITCYNYSIDQQRPTEKYIRNKMQLKVFKIMMDINQRLIDFQEKNEKILDQYETDNGLEAYEDDESDEEQQENQDQQEQDDDDDNQGDSSESESDTDQSLNQTDNQLDKVKNNTTTDEEPANKNYNQMLITTSANTISTTTTSTVTSTLAAVNTAATNTTANNNNYMINNLVNQNNQTSSNSNSTGFKFSQQLQPSQSLLSNFQQHSIIQESEEDSDSSQDNNSSSNNSQRKKVSRQIMNFDNIQKSQNTEIQVNQNSLNIPCKLFSDNKLQCCFDNTPNNIQSNGMHSFNFQDQLLENRQKSKSLNENLNQNINESNEYNKQTLLSNNKLLSVQQQDSSLQNFFVNTPKNNKNYNINQLKNNRNSVSLQRQKNPDIARKERRSSTYILVKNTPSGKSKIIKELEVNYIKSSALKKNQLMAGQTVQNSNQGSQSQQLANQIAKGKINYEKFQHRTSTINTDLINHVIDSNKLKNKITNNSIINTSSSQQQYKKLSSIIKSNPQQLISSLSADNNLNSDQLLLILKKQSLKQDISFSLKSIQDHFDQLKVYQIYFPHNNLDSVLYQFNHKIRLKGFKLNGRKTKKFLNRLSKPSNNKQGSIKVKKVVEQSKNNKKSSIEQFNEQIQMNSNHILDLQTPTEDPANNDFKQQQKIKKQISFNINTQSDYKSNISKVKTFRGGGIVTGIRSSNLNNQLDEEKNKDKK